MMHKFKSDTVVRVVYGSPSVYRYRVYGRQLSLLPGRITINGEKLVQVTFDDGGVEYHDPQNLKEYSNVDSPLKWFGGKHYLATRIVALMPRDVHYYIEPYGGSAAVLLARDPVSVTGCAEILNDMHGELMNFWQVLRNPVYFEEFQRRVVLTPFSEQAWDEADASKQPPHLHAVHRAINFFIRCRQSFAGNMTSFAAISTNRLRRGMNEQVSAYLSAVDNLPEICNRLRTVLLLNRPALQVIEQYDSEHIFWYLDPPYMPETRAAGGYEHEMSVEDHTALLDKLSVLKGKFILSGYRCELYDRYSDKHNWFRIDINMPNNAAGGDVKRDMVESLWMNYNPYQK